MGMALLVGITAVASMALFLASTTLTESTQSSIEHQQAEQSMSQLAETADQVANGEAGRGEFTVRGSSSGHVRATSDAGTLNVTVRNRSTDTTLLSLERSLGAVVYESSDGTEIAYQAGGVWRRDTQGRSRLVSPPEFHYRADPDPTITFPVVLVRDEFSRSGSTSGELVASDSNRHYPDRPNHYNPLQQGSVRITIESQYCEGWEQYFRERTDGSAAEACDAGTPGELEIQFSVPFELDGLDSGVMLGGGTGDADDFDGIDDDGDIGDSTTAPSATPIVEARIEEAQEAGRVLPDEGTIDDPGLYWDDGNLSGSDVTFDTSNGDIEIATTRSPIFTGQEDVDVVGDGNVTIHATGDLVDNGGGSGEIGTYGRASQLRLFFHSDLDRIGQTGQNTDFHGLIYAPNAQVELFRGNNDASGALVAEDYDFGNTEMEIDPALANLQLYEELGDAPFYYLHVSETEVHVEE